MEKGGGEGGAHEEGRMAFADEKRRIGRRKDCNKEDNRGIILGKKRLISGNPFGGE